MQTLTLKTKRNISVPNNLGPLLRSAGYLLHCHLGARLVHEYKYSTAAAAEDFGIPCLRQLNVSRAGLGASLPLLASLCAERCAAFALFRAGALDLDALYPCATQLFRKQRAERGLGGIDGQVVGEKRALRVGIGDLGRVRADVEVVRCLLRVRGKCRDCEREDGVVASLEGSSRGRHSVCVARVVRDGVGGLRCNEILATAGRTSLHGLLVGFAPPRSSHLNTLVRNLTKCRQESPPC